MADTPTFFWQGEGAALNAGDIRLRIETIAQDPLHWAVFGRPLAGRQDRAASGYQRLGTVGRDPKDATPFGEQLLWSRLQKLLESVGRDPARWTGPARGS